MSANPYQKSTEYLTSKMPKLTRAQALQQMRAPALGLIAVSAVALTISFVGILYTAVHFGIKLMEGDQTEQVYEEPPPGESRADREERLAQKKKRDAESNFGMMSTIFIVALTFLLLNAIVLSGALQMRRLKKHRASVAAAAVSVIPVLTPLVIVGIPFGAWAMIKLQNPEIRRYFTN